jgi:hypothetical protein
MNILHSLWGKLQQCEAIAGAVNKIIKFQNETDLISPQTKGRCGQKTKTTFKDDMFLLRQSETDPLKTNFDFQKILATAGFQVYDSTVRCKFLEFGRKSRKPAKKQFLTEAVKKKILSLGKELQHIGEKVLFSD